MSFLSVSLDQFSHRPTPELKTSVMGTPCAYGLRYSASTPVNGDGLSERKEELLKAKKTIFKKGGGEEGEKERKRGIRNGC